MTNTVYLLIIAVRGFMVASTPVSGADVAPHRGVVSFYDENAPHMALNAKFTNFFCDVGAMLSGKSMVSPIWTDRGCPPECIERETIQPDKVYDHCDDSAETGDVTIALGQTPHFRDLPKKIGADAASQSVGSSFAFEQAAYSKAHKRHPSRAEPSASSTRPDIVVVMVDDLGFSDFGCYGGEVDTPNIDALAADGLRFSQFYNAGRCCPTRASLLSGLYAHKTGLGYMTWPDFGRPGYRADLNRNCVTIATVLRAAGYHTAMVGKWHVCRDIAPHGPKHNWPLQRGFDRFYGTLNAAGSLWNPPTLTEGNDPVMPEGDYYYTEALTNKAVQYVRQTPRNKRLFLYVAHPAPHWPLHARPKAIAKYRGRFASGWDVLRAARRERMIKSRIISPKWQLSVRDSDVPEWKDVEHKEWQQRRMEAYAAMIDHVDLSVGSIVDALRETGRLENTLIMILSDNGGESLEHPDGMIGDTGLPWSVMPYVPDRTRDGRPMLIGDIPGVAPGADETFAGYGRGWANLSNTPFRKFKKSSYEGGIATPFIAHWPDGFASRNEIRRVPAHVIDVMATCVDVAEATYPAVVDNQFIAALDGQSLVPVFRGESGSKRTLFWEHEGNRAVRRGRWKIVSEYPANWELYDMRNDRAETTDLADSFPDQLDRLSRLYDRWAANSQVVPWQELAEEMQGHLEEALEDARNPK